MPRKKTKIRKLSKKTEIRHYNNWLCSSIPSNINAIQPGTIIKDFTNPNKILGTVVNEVGRTNRTIQASPSTGAVLSQLIQIKIRPNNINYNFPYDYNSPPTGTLYSGDFTNSVSFTPTATYPSGSTQPSFTLYKINTYYDFV